MRLGAKVSILMGCLCGLLFISVAEGDRDPFQGPLPLEQSEPIAALPLQPPVIMMTTTRKLQYIKVNHLLDILKGHSSLLTAGETLSEDERSNQIIYTGSREHWQQLISLIQRLDIPVQQVAIQARIMNMDRQFERSLGIRFGVSRPNHLSGTLTGANEIANHALHGQPQPVSDVPLEQRLNLDLPATIDGVAQAPSLGLALVKLGKGFLLDLELSAVEAEGGGKLLSAPHLLTANGVAAHIEAGEEIPFEESTSSGATAVAFKKAVLGLRVTPQILPNHRIILNIKVNQDKRGSAVVKGEPSVDTRQISTQVVVADGETVVLGGILEQSQFNKAIRVPFLWRLPLIGYLFQSRYRLRDQEELLVFITPTIISQEQNGEMPS